MSSGDFRRSERLAVAVLLSLALAACNGPGSSPAGSSPAGSSSAGSSPAGEAPASSGSSGAQTKSPASQSPTPVVAHDGSTVLPTGGVACDRLSPELIRQVLGGAAVGLQPAEVDGNVDPNGVRRESCIYPLDAERTTTHAVVLELTAFPSGQELQASSPFETLLNPVEVPGLQGLAKFARNDLSGSTEYVLVAADGPNLTRLIVSQPPPASWSTEDALIALKRLGGY